MKYLYLIFLSIFLASCQQTYYDCSNASKEEMGNFMIKCLEISGENSPHYYSCTEITKEIFCNKIPNRE